MDQNDKLPRLTPAEYWEWRTTIAEMETAKANHRCVEMEVKLLSKEAEILAVRTQLHRSAKLEGARKQSVDMQAEYARIKEALEGRLGVSLSGKVIDEITYEVKELPNESPIPQANH